MEKKQFGKVFALALLLSTPMFASEGNDDVNNFNNVVIVDAPVADVVAPEAQDLVVTSIEETPVDVAPEVSIEAPSVDTVVTAVAPVALTRVQAAKEVAQQKVQAAKDKIQAGLTVAKQYGVDTKQAFINRSQAIVDGSKAQVSTFVNSSRLEKGTNAVAFAGGAYAAYDAAKMVPSVNADDAKTVKAAKYTGKAVAGSVAFATQFAAIKFLVANWNVLLHPMQDKAKTAKVVAVALANIAYYTPQVRALVVRAASYVGIKALIAGNSAFTLGSAVAAKMPTVKLPAMPSMFKRSSVVIPATAEGSEDVVDTSVTAPVAKKQGPVVSPKPAKSILATAASFVGSKASAATSAVTFGRAGMSTAQQKEDQFISDAINLAGAVKAMFDAQLGNVSRTNIYFTQQGTAVRLKASMLPTVFASSSVGADYIGTSDSVRGLVNELLKFYMVRELNLTKNIDCIQFMNDEIARIIAELQS